MDGNAASCCNILAAILIAEALTVADLVSPGLSGVKEDQEVEVEVQASEAVVVEGGGGTDPSSLQKSLMHSWMPTMPKYVLFYCLR